VRAGVLHMEDATGVMKKVMIGIMMKTMMRMKIGM
jgi:hypothetical protein